MTPTSRLYTGILAQPQAIQEVLVAPGSARKDAALLLASARRVYLVGTGTSGHAATIGEYLLRAAGVDVIAMSSFDFVNYPRPVGPNDVLIVISHTARTQFSRKAIERAGSHGVRVIGITGHDSTMDGAMVSIGTVTPERSDTYSVSFTTTLVALAMLACDTAALLDYPLLDLALALPTLPGAMQQMLEQANDLMAASQLLAQHGRLVLAGAGPNAAIAREGALKVKESAYVTAEGFELENVLQGGLQAVQAGDLAVMLVADGLAAERGFDLIRALQVIGAAVLVVADARIAGRVQSVLTPRLPAWIVPFPAVPELLSPVLTVVPLQLLAAFTAAILGTNADNFRFDETAYKQAVLGYEL